MLNVILVFLYAIYALQSESFETNLCPQMLHTVFPCPAQAKRSDILAYHGIKPTRVLRPQMTSGMPSMLMSNDRQPAVINMFVMPIESTQGVIVNGPAMLMAFRKNATTTKV